MKKNLASKGRFGDTQMRKVGGQLSHVSQGEANHMDAHGKAGERDVQALGSGTINPETGKPEYWVLPVVAGIAAIGANYFGQGKKDYSGKNFGLSSLWDYSVGEHGIGKTLKWAGPFGDTEWGSLDPNETGRKKQEAKEILSTGLEGLQDKHAAYMGDGGYLQQETGLKMDTAVLGNKANMSKLMDTRETSTAKIGGAYSARNEYRMDQAFDDTADAFSLKTEGIGLEADKSKSDFMSGLKTQMSDMLIKYMDVADAPYSGQQLDEMNSIFDEYEQG